MIRKDAAGIADGPEGISVAVDPQKDARPIRHYGTSTAELYRIANWLKACRVRTVAMDSTGVYWISLYQVLEERGFEMYLVDPRHYKNALERKPEMCDSAWLQYLHAAGLLQGAFQPSEEDSAFRTIMQHRSGMVQDASKEIQHLQETLDEMNVQLHRVVSDIAGASGLAILDAMVAGERDGRRLAALHDGSVTASEESMVAALESNYLPGYLLLIEQSLERYRFYQKSIGECDQLLREELDKLAG